MKLLVILSLMGFALADGEADSDAGYGYGGYGGYHHYGKRSADSEPKAVAKPEADPEAEAGYYGGYGGYGGYGYRGYGGYGYGRGFYGRGYLGKRSADAEPEAASEAGVLYE